MTCCGVWATAKSLTAWNYYDECEALDDLGGILGAALAVRRRGVAGSGPEPEARASTEAKVVPVTVSALERRPIERTVDVIGTLRGWEQVTIGSKRAGRVIKVHQDMGDRVEPGAPLVDLEPIDARLAVEEAETKYLGALVKLGITRRQAEEFVQTYGISEELLYNRVTAEAITKLPSVIEKHVAREKAAQNLSRQRALTKRGAGTPQELEDAENESRSAVAAYENAIGAARTVIADAVAAKVALSKAEQTLNDMTIRAPQPRHLPPSHEPHRAGLPTASPSDRSPKGRSSRRAMPSRTWSSRTRSASGPRSPSSSRTRSASASRSGSPPGRIPR